MEASPPLLFADLLLAAGGCGGEPGVAPSAGRVAAAVVGIIAEPFFQIGWAAQQRISSLPVAMLLFLVALTMMWRLKSAWVTPLIIAMGPLARWLIVR